MTHTIPILHKPGRHDGVETSKQATTPQVTVTACLGICSQGPGKRLATVDLDGVSCTRDAFWHKGPLWVLDGGHWVPSGEFDVVGTGIADGDGVGLSWGAFEIRHSSLGAFDGTWAWHWAAGQDGHGVGHGVHSSHGRVIAVTFAYNDPEGLPDAPTGMCREDKEVTGEVYLRITVG